MEKHPVCYDKLWVSINLQSKINYYRSTTDENSATELTTDLLQGFSLQQSATDKNSVVNLQ